MADIIYFLNYICVGIFSIREFLHETTGKQLSWQSVPLHVNSKIKAFVTSFNLHINSEGLER